MRWDRYCRVLYTKVFSFYNDAEGRLQMHIYIKNGI